MSLPENGRQDGWTSVRKYRTLSKLNNMNLGNCLEQFPILFSETGTYDLCDYFLTHSFDFAYLIIFYINI